MAATTFSTLAADRFASGPVWPRFSPALAGGIVAMHLLGLLWLSRIAPPANIPPQPLMVQMIEVGAQPHAVTPTPTPPAEKSTPRPRRQPTPASPERLLAADTSADASTSTTTPPPEPAATVKTASAAAPAVITAARFDADYLQNPAPAYPALSRRLREEGKVMLRVFVETSGRPSQIEIKSSSGSPRLDQSAQEAVSRWKFIPARQGQDVIGAWVLVPIIYRLRD